MAAARSELPGALSLAPASTGGIADVHGVSDMYNIAAPFATDPVTGTAAATSGFLSLRFSPVGPTLREAAGQQHFDGA